MTRKRKRQPATMVRWTRTAPGEWVGESRGGAGGKIRLVAWLRAHDRQIAAFLNLEKARRVVAAAAAPEVKP